MLLVTTALSGLLAGVIQTAPTPVQAQPAPAQTPVAQAATETQTPPAQADAEAAETDDAAPAPVEVEGAYDLGTVDATGQRLRGAVDTDIPPDVSLTAEQIQAYGASNIAELMTYLEPITRSSSGRTDLPPVFLVNGRRISGFDEIRGIPTEAIERTDVLPEQVALQFGYRAEQRVVNFVLKANFRSLTGELTFRAPTQGGRTTTELEGNVLRIGGTNRWSADAEYERSTPLFESERDIVRDDGLGAYQTLLAESERATVRGTIKRDLNGTTQATVNASLEDTSSQSFNGLAPGLPEAGLQRRTDGLNGRLGLVLDGFLGEDWRWTFNGAYERSETDTATAALDPADLTHVTHDTANAVSQLLSGELVLNGDVYDLPAGGVSSTFKVGADTRSLDSTSTRLGATTDRSQSRDRVFGQGTFNLPIASRRQEVLTALGDLSVNATVGFEELSDFGGLPSYNIGLNWSPIESLSLLASYADEQGAPTIGQLNDPILVTPNVPVFDFATGTTVLVSQTSGGNPDLDADNRHVWRVGGTWRPLKDQDLSIQSTWTYSRTDDYISAFPTITSELEAALPGRFTRNLAGDLVAIDARPLNFERYERQDIRTGFHYSRAFGTPNPQAAPLPGQPGSARPAPGAGGPMGAPIVIRGDGGGGRGSGGPSGGGGGGMQIRMGGGGRGPAMQPGQGRFNLALFHTVRLQDEILIAEGVPVIDLLDGGAASSRGGSPRNELQAMGGVFRNGMGAFMNANWREGTRIDGGTGPDLTFSDQATVGLNVFIDFNQRTSWVEKQPWLKGARLQFGVQNLFDSRPEVTSSNGVVPLTYQSDYLDPLGRTVSVTFRKILF